ncbi:SHOCT domain-containing protein [Lactobacillus sp. Sy-1]|uniref:SHOCT domain-containing protein n=1 Tax=Lactobacillus sp. Sy-1 TaxID=2109645 RepID=UPI001C582ABB|nr:SHOCT domain-containing protein [Lactobacillus sp. Sy-1]MBW1605045.1 SHOCT domain-containing protein [Lactobacillus sp. Sy-1]
MVYVVIILVILFGLYIWRASRHQHKQAQNVNHRLNVINDSDDNDVQLKHLKELLDSGVIDKEDYQQSKQRILKNKI